MLTERPTLPGVLAAGVAAHPSRAAMVTADGSITYGELATASTRCAAGLVAAGVAHGDRVALMAPNTIEWAVTALAVARIGAVLVPLSTLLRPPELLAQLQVSAASHLVVWPEFRGRRYLDELDTAAPGVAAVLADGGRHPAAPSLRAVWSIDALPGTSAPEPLVAAMEAQVRPAHDLVIMFTSGSRGVPKGVIHTHGGALRATAAGLAARGVGPGERLYVPMPLFWVGGFGGGLLSVLIAGATLATEAEPDPAATLALLARERVTLFRGWPDQAARLAAHPDAATTDLSALNDFTLGPLLPPHRRPAPGARANLFGMTESFGPYCADPLDRDMPSDKWGSCGRPFDGVEVRITDPERLVPREPGEQGEIWLRGPNLLRGICGRHRSEVFTPDGWYRTGDLGRLDADGYLWYSGRLDDMFKVRGATVYPSEVEAALRSVPGVAQAHVTDVRDQGAPEVAALVVSSLAASEIEAQVRTRLSAFKVPTRWLVTSDPGSVPMLATGKVDKAALQALLVALP